MSDLRKSCRATKGKEKCSNYSYELFRCKLGLVPATCDLIEQPKAGSKKAKQAQQMRDFYGKF